jgi:beta-D-xylosidase 4
LGWKNVGTPEAQQLAKQAAIEGISLLKNDKNVLPLNKKIRKVALIGPYANATTQLQGNYQGTAQYLQSMVWGAGNAGYRVSYALGTAINTTSTAGFDSAISAARAADVVIYCGGIDNTIEAEGLDRTTIVWPGNQLDLIGQLSKLGKPLIVVQFGGGQIDDSTVLSNGGVESLLWAGYPSQAGGSAVFDILQGIAAPAGRLPVTQYPARYVNEVAMTDMQLRPGTDNPGRTYRWFNDAVLPFGYGLHYTEFEVSWVTRPGRVYETDRVASPGSRSVPVDRQPFDTFTLAIKNKGKVSSDYVALLFLKTENGGPRPYPVKSLIGYERVKNIRPGETRQVGIPVTVGSVARTAENGDLALYPGTYTILVDVNDEHPTMSFALSGPAKVLDDFPQPPR